MEKHVYSILATERTKEPQVHINTKQKTRHTKQKNKKAGPWVPSLEN